MKRDYTKASELLNTTETVREIERAAFNLGLGDGADLLSSGLRPQSNAAQKALEDLTNRKKKDERYAELVHAQLLRTLSEINQELDWLHEQIQIEEKAIGENLEALNFIATLDEDNIMGEDGEPRDDVKALLAKHGYDDVDGLDVAEIMLILRQIETDLVADTTDRQNRIDGYHKRSDHLMDIKQDIRKHIAPDASDEMREKIEQAIAYEPHETNFQLMAEADSIDDNLAGKASTQEVRQTIEKESASFTMPTGL